MEQSFLDITGKLIAIKSQLEEAHEREIAYIRGGLSPDSPRSATSSSDTLAAKQQAAVKGPASKHEVARRSGEPHAPSPLDCIRPPVTTPFQLERLDPASTEDESTGLPTPRRQRSRSEGEGVDSWQVSGFARVDSWRATGAAVASHEVTDCSASPGTREPLSPTPPEWHQASGSLGSIAASSGDSASGVQEAISPRSSSSRVRIQVEPDNGPSSESAILPGQPHTGPGSPRTDRSYAKRASTAPMESHMSDSPKAQRAVSEGLNFGAAGRSKLSRRTWKDAVGLATKVASMTSSFEKKLEDNSILDVFKLKDHWVVDESQMLRMKSKNPRRTAEQDKAEIVAIMSDSDSRPSRLTTRQEEASKYRAIHPQSLLRLSWDLTSLFLWSYDLIFLPMIVFDIPQSVFFTIMDWLGVLYWSSDIGASFMTGVYIDGALVRNQRRVAVHYVQTWLPFDISVVLIDWATLVAQDHSAWGLARAVRGGRFLRLLRLLRFLRLLRLIKAGRILKDLQKRITSPTGILAVSISKLLFIGMLLAHTLACLWYLFGTLSTAGWVFDRGIEGVALGDRYLWSFMFSLGRLHPSTMQSNLELGTRGERILAILACLLALVFSSVFISIITSTMTEIKRMREARTHRIRVLSEYVRQHDIGPLLAGQARNWLDKEQNSELRGVDQELMQVLPASLMTEMRVEAWSPVLGYNPLFSMIRLKHPRTECKLCYEALAEVYVMAKKHIFKTGDACGQMLFSVSGTWFYALGKDSETPISPRCVDKRSTAEWRETLEGGDEDGDTRNSPSRAQERRFSEVSNEEFVFEPGVWMCEACLYTSWQHCGDLSALTEGLLLAVKADAFAAVLKQYEQAFADVVIYARVFIAELNDSRADPNRGGGPISDLPPKLMEREHEHELIQRSDSLMSSQLDAGSSLGLSLARAVGVLPSQRRGSKGQGPPLNRAQSCSSLIRRGSFDGAVPQSKRLLLDRKHRSSLDADKQCELAAGRAATP